MRLQPRQSLRRVLQMAVAAFNLSSFLNFFEDTLHTILRNPKYLSDTFLGMTLLVQKYNFMDILHHFNKTTCYFGVMTEPPLK